MTSAFYSKAQGIVIVFDITNRESFKALPSWIRDIREVGAVAVITAAPAAAALGAVVPVDRSV
jgi:GTPase SAR1 family protein